MRGNIREVISSWAQQSKLAGHNATRSVYYSGEFLYSYGAHHLLARLFEVNSFRFALVNHHACSMTTKKHRSVTQAGLRREGIPYVLVYNLRPEKNNHLSNIYWFKDRLRVAGGWRLSGSHETVAQVMRDINKYVGYFGLEVTCNLYFDYYTLSTKKPEPPSLRRKRRQIIKGTLGEVYD